MGDLRATESRDNSLSRPIVGGHRESHHPVTGTANQALANANKAAEAPKRHWIVRWIHDFGQRFLGLFSSPKKSEEAPVQRQPDIHKLNKIMGKPPEDPRRGVHTPDREPHHYHRMFQ